MGWRKRDLEKKITSANERKWSVYITPDKRDRGILTFSKLAVNLSAENMEQVGRSGHVGNLHIAVLVLTIDLIWAWEDARILVAELEISLNSTRGMLGTLTVVTVRQRHDEAGSL